MERRGCSIMRMIISIFLILASVFANTSCNALDYANWEQRSKNLATIILSELTDDVESELDDYFCDIVIKEIDDLNAEIINAEIFLTGVKPEINRISVSGEEWIDYGEYTLISPFVYTEFTDSISNEEYSMSISMYLLNVNQPEKEGISLITIKRMSDGEIINI
jgi:hypothetical protein